MPLSQACLLLAKHLVPESPDPKRKTMQNNFQPLIELIQLQLHQITKVSKDKCLRQGKVTSILLNAFFHLVRRAKQPQQRQFICTILLQVNIEYEKIAKQCIVEGDVRVVQHLLDLLRVILRIEDG